MHKIIMKLTTIIMAFSVFMGCFLQRVEAADNNHTIISDFFFPQTKNWISIESAPQIEKEIFLKIKNQLKTTFLLSRIPDKLEEKDCSFIARAIEEGDLNFFRLIDADADGVKDVIYTGSAQCREGDVFLVWYAIKNGFEVRQSILWGSKALRISPGKDLKLSSVAVGCCADLIDEYDLGNISHIRADKIIKTTKTTIQPDELFNNLKHFKNGSETILRSTPEKKDSYDESLSGREQMAVFGNILSKYLPGVTGDILAEHKDKYGRWWAYVLLDEQSNMLRYHSPFAVNVGWVLKQGIKETK